MVAVRSIIDEGVTLTLLSAVSRHMVVITYYVFSCTLTQSMHGGVHTDVMHRAWWWLLHQFVPTMMRGDVLFHAAWT